MKSKFTPGPWSVLPGELMVRAKGCAVAEIIPQQNERANAKLIVSAPTLYAMVEKAEQLASIASDWNLDQVEIDGEMVSTLDLRNEFSAALKEATI